MKKTLIVLVLLSSMLCLNYAVNAQTNKRVVAAYIKGSQKDKIDIDTLARIYQIDCTDSDFEIVSFTLSTMVSGMFQECNGKGNIIDNSMQLLLSKAGKGSKIFFENIQVKSLVDGKIHTLASIVLTVIDN